MCPFPSPLAPHPTHTHSVSSSLKTAAQVVFIPKQQRRVGCPAVLAASERLTLAGDISHLPLPTTTGTTVLSDLIRVLLYSAVSILRGKPSPAFRGGAAGPRGPPLLRAAGRSASSAGRSVLGENGLSVPPSTSHRQRRNALFRTGNDLPRGLGRGSALF